jgi:hypothetical protein
VFKTDSSETLAVIKLEKKKKQKSFNAIVIAFEKVPKGEALSSYV